jgi:hypothetical protein
MNPTAQHVIRRAKRQAAVTIGAHRATERLRALAGAIMPLSEARRVADIYCRRVGLPRADDTTIRMLMLPEIATLTNEAIDELIALIASDDGEGDE